jgi:hypothetical protein
MLNSGSLHTMTSCKTFSIASRRSTAKVIPQPLSRLSFIFQRLAFLYSKMALTNVTVQTSCQSTTVNILSKRFSSVYVKQNNPMYVRSQQLQQRWC